MRLTSCYEMLRWSKVTYHRYTIFENLGIFCREWMNAAHFFLRMKKMGKIQFLKNNLRYFSWLIYIFIIDIFLLYPKNSDTGEINEEDIVYCHVPIFFYLTM